MDAPDPNPALSALRFRTQNAIAGLDVTLGVQTAS